MDINDLSLKNSNKLPAKVFDRRSTFMDPRYTAIPSGKLCKLIPGIKSK